MKFLHTADWQLGKPFARIEDEHKRALVRQARVDAIGRIGRVASGEGASFVVVAGDLFDSPVADKQTVAAACSAIGHLGLPVYVIPGNHDHGGPESVWRQEFFVRQRKADAPNLTVLLEAKPYVRDDSILLPCPLLRRAVVSDPTEWLRDPSLFAGLEDPEKPRIVLAHGSTTGFGARWEDEDEESGDTNRIDLDRIPAGEVDYVALGDWHGTKQVAPAAWYAGTPEVDRFPKGPDNDPGNVLVVDARRGEAPAVRKIATGRLGWHERAIDLSGDGALDRLEAEMVALLEHRTNEDLLRLGLSGTIGIDAASRLERTLESLETRLLRLKLDDRVRTVPTDGEIGALTQREADPLIARVASDLVERARLEGDEAEVARLALRELYAACQEGAGA